MSIHGPAWARRLLVASAAVVLVLVILAPGAGALPTGRWVGTWAASPQPPYTTDISSTGLTDQTVREVLHTSVGGSSLRLRLTNTFGTAPLAVDQVTVARRLGGAAILAGSSRTLTFGGREAVTIPAGARAITDPAGFAVRADGDVVVSLYLHQATGPTTWHQLGQQTTWISTAGNHATDAGAAAFTTTVQSFFFVDGLDVSAGPNLGAVVTLGDSITDGFNSTPNTNARWPNDLARRLLAAPARRREAVDNAGISGNRILNDSQCCGVNALARVDRDVLAQDGVRDVILLEGINDIGFSQLTNPETAPHTDVSADQIIFGMEQLIEAAHLRGLRIFGATLTPFGGAAYASTAGEVKREAVNAWIRDSSDFDGVIDFDAVTRDPANPTQFLPVYDSGDHLHPSDAGYAAMAASIRLTCLSGKRIVAPDGSRRDCTLPATAAAVRTAVGMD
jgi:lysophospholipase L1-like esterase